VVRLTSSSNDGALAAAVEGCGLTRLLSYQIADHLQSGQLKVVLQDCEPSVLPVHLVHRDAMRRCSSLRTEVRGVLWPCLAGPSGHARAHSTAVCRLNRGRHQGQVPNPGKRSRASLISTPKPSPSRLISSPSSRATVTPARPASESCQPLPLGALAKKVVGPR